MSVPASRNSSSRARRRRTGNTPKVSRALFACPSCKALIVPHQACTACGTYRGRDVVRTAMDKKIAKKKAKATAPQH